MIKPENFNITETDALLKEYEKSGELFDSMVRFGLSAESFTELQTWRESCANELRNRGVQLFDLRGWL